MARGVAIVGAILVLSLAVNLFLAGGFLGGQFHHRMPPPPSQGAEMLNHRLDAIWQHLPDADQVIARGVVEHHRDAILDRYRAMREANAHAGRIVHAEQYDDAAAHAALDSANQSLQAYRALLQETYMEAAGKISPEGRARLQLFAQ